MEVLPQMLQLLQGMLLQRPQHLLRHPAGPMLGLRVCHDHLPACLADHALSACLHYQLRLRAEVLHHVFGVLSGSRLSNVWSVLQQRCRQEPVAAEENVNPDPPIAVDKLVLICFVYRLFLHSK